MLTHRGVDPQPVNERPSGEVALSTTPDPIADQDEMESPAVMVAVFQKEQKQDTSLGEFCQEAVKNYALSETLQILVRPWFAVLRVPATRS